MQREDRTKQNSCSYKVQQIAWSNFEGDPFEKILGPDGKLEKQLKQHQFRGHWPWEEDESHTHSDREGSSHEVMQSGRDGDEDNSSLAQLHDRLVRSLRRFRAIYQSACTARDYEKGTQKRALRAVLKKRT